MSIEIRQMVVNADVRNPESPLSLRQDQPIDMASLKTEILAACELLFRQLLQREKER